MTEPTPYSDAELTLFARGIALSILEKLSAKGVSASDVATVTAIAACEVHCQCHGLAGLEHLRTAIDVAERDLMARNGGGIQ